MRLAPFTSRYAQGGMVCAVDHLAAEAGVALLRAGGNAVDAAVAASAVLAVTTQHMCGMGGDLFALVHEGEGPPAVINASGRAGSGADAGRLRAEGHSVMPPRGDIRAVPVPGCVDGWLALHGRFGRRDIDEVLRPARRYAADGFPASPTLARAAAAVADLAGGEPFRDATTPGSIVRRSGVARTLDSISSQGRNGFYLGEFGRGLIELGRGEYDEADLAVPAADWVEPLGADVFGATVWTVPPNSQGYLTLAGALIAQGLELPADPDSPLWAHLMVEAARQAAFDRLDVLHEHADGAALIAADRLEPRRAAISPAHAAVLPGRYGEGGTIALCAVDANRMGVSLIQSNAGGFGAYIAEPTTGIFLQNRGIGFSLEAGHVAEYGPGRRPPHTLSPALVTAKGRLELVLGTMGGDSQPQILLQLLARLLAAGEPVGDAIAAGRWALTNADEPSGFRTWVEGCHVEVELEATCPPEWRDFLVDRGHTVSPVRPPGHGFGHAHAIAVVGDHLEGASDPRSLAGSAAAY